MLRVELEDERKKLDQLILCKIISHRSFVSVLTCILYVDRPDLREHAHFHSLVRLAALLYLQGISDIPPMAIPVVHLVRQALTLVSISTPLIYLTTDMHTVLPGRNHARSESPRTLLCPLGSIPTPNQLHQPHLSLCSPFALPPLRSHPVTPRHPHPRLVLFSRIIRPSTSG